MARVLGLALAVTLTLLLATSSPGAKKPAPSSIPAGFVRIESVDVEKMTFTLKDDTTTYKFTKDTTNRDKISVGVAVKLSVKDKTKDEVTSVEVAPVVPPKKKTK